MTPVPIAMVGLNRVFLDLLARAPREYAVALVEEPDLIRHDPGAYSEPPLGALLAAPYQQTLDHVGRMAAWCRDRGVVAVVPGKEYAVATAAALSEALGLEGPGPHAADACTDKLVLRAACALHGLASPRFSPAASADDIRRFYRGRPMVLKPANRQASVGVIRIDDVGLAEAAWQEVTAATEGPARVPSRPLAWRYIVEEYVEGADVSVETLLARGRVRFRNITLKDTPSDRYFPSLGHTVPAPLDAAVQQALLAAVDRALDAIGARTGLFHSDWKLGPNGPVILECAARLPGDRVPELILHAYGCNLGDALTRVAAGEDVDLPTHATRAAGIHWFTPDEGRLLEIEGVATLEHNAGVISYGFDVEPGEEVVAATDSWRRAGHVAVAADDHERLDEALAAVRRGLHFRVDGRSKALR